MSIFGCLANCSGLQPHTSAQGVRLQTAPTFLPDHEPSLRVIYQVFWLVVITTALLTLSGCTALWGDDPTPTPALPPTRMPTPVPLPIVTATAASASSITPAPQPTQSVSPSQVSTDPSAIFVQAVISDVETFNPVLTTNSTTQAVARQILPVLIGQDAQSGLITPMGLAERWTISEDGKVYTFALRHNLAWSDGAPVTAHDLQFTYAALADATVQSPYRASVEAIVSITATTDYTAVVTLTATDCSALQMLRRPLLPSHLFAADLSDLRTNPWNADPTVGAGPLLYQGRTPGIEIDLVRNPAYWQGAPLLAGWRYAIIADPAEQVRQLISGTVDLAPFDPRTDLGTIKTTPYLAVHSHPLDSYTFLALNLADPQNPQPGRDANDALLPQPSHPILGDVRVREAIADALNIGDLLDVINGQLYSYQANGYLPMAASWVYDPSAPSYTGGPDKAKALLEAAGWQASNDNGVRTKNGLPLQLTLITNQENGQRTRMGELIQQNLETVGFAITFTPLPFAELTSTLLDQRFDLALAGWEQVGADPATNTFWHSRDDQPGSGFNFVSFQDADVDRWLDVAMYLCDSNQRKSYYQQVQQRIHEQVPYVFIGGPVAFWGYNQRWQQVQLGPWGLVANVQEWYKLPK